MSLIKHAAIVAFATLIAGCWGADENRVADPESDHQMIPAGIGVRRESAIEILAERFGARFRDASDETPAEHLYQATIGGVPVKLWGNPADLEAITIIGSFEGDVAKATVLVLDEILDIVTPDWSRERRAEWFMKAAQSDPSLNVSTLQGNVSVTVVSMDMGGFTMRTISFTPYEH